MSNPEEMQQMIESDDMYSYYSSQYSTEDSSIDVWYGPPDQGRYEAEYLNHQLHSVFGASIPPQPFNQNQANDPNNPFTAGVCLKFDGSQIPVKVPLADAKQSTKYYSKKYDNLYIIMPFKTITHIRTDKRRKYHNPKITVVGSNHLPKELNPDEKTSGV